VAERLDLPFTTISWQRHDSSRRRALQQGGWPRLGLSGNQVPCGRPVGSHDVLGRQPTRPVTRAGEAQLTPRANPCSATTCTGGSFCRLARWIQHRLDPMSMRRVVKVGTSLLRGFASRQHRCRGSRSWASSLTSQQQAPGCANQRVVTSGAVGPLLPRQESWPREAWRVGALQPPQPIGQGRLMGPLRGFAFAATGLVAQVLLTRGIWPPGARYPERLPHPEQLLSWGVVPIVNENDTLRHRMSCASADKRHTLGAVAVADRREDEAGLLNRCGTVYSGNPAPMPRPGPIEGGAGSGRTGTPQPCGLKAAASGATGGMNHKLTGGPKRHLQRNPVRLRWPLNPGGARRPPSPAKSWAHGCSQPRPSTNTPDPIARAGLAPCPLG